ncbi:MAG: gliding motility protein GldC [Cyclobacteriaceae bacterium]|nr:gliding motility protein GldC [Cytophagales bacterium]MBX2900430.1 gliding motility protein GldC [Cyclobacteriaceae bacterium]
MTTKQSTIQFTIQLDSKNIPERIRWEATDKPEDTPEDTKSISVALWDSQQKNTMRIDLWTKDMPVDEMKRFYIENIGGIAQSVLTATGDEAMANEINALCDRLVELVRNQK